MMFWDYAEAARVYRHRGRRERTQNTIRPQLCVKVFGYYVRVFVGRAEVAGLAFADSAQCVVVSNLETVPHTINDKACELIVRMVPQRVCPRLPTKRGDHGR